MNLYLDTSSFLKLFLNEQHSEKVRGWIDAASLVSVCRIALPEAMSAVERRFRSGDLSQDDRDRTVDRIAGDWGDFLALDFDEQKAGQLALRHGLRALDAIQLAAAGLLTGGDKEDLAVFSSFDDRLNQAARTEGLRVLTARK
ncbi:MAG: type II toxin-antitoxin system VapC family toxin [Legionella sp.]|nr:type II toxin-antitoxin system VapC family toxin [Legionella sp.]